MRGMVGMWGLERQQASAHFREVRVYSLRLRSKFTKIHKLHKSNILQSISKERKRKLQIPEFTFFAQNAPFRRPQFSPRKTQNESLNNRKNRNESPETKNRKQPKNNHP